MSLSLSLLAAARESPDRVALVADGSVWTFAQLAHPVRAEMERLPDGDPVALVGETRFETLVTLYALMELGRPVLLLHPRSTPDERRRLVAITDLGRQKGTEGRGLDESPLAVVPTSGTSGRPKAVVLSRRAFRAAAEASAANLGWRDDDRWLLSLPVAHVGGLSIVTRCLLARRAVVIETVDRFEAEAVRVVDARRVTLLSLVPTLLGRLLRRTPAWTPPRHLRAILVGGAAASRVLLAEAADRGWPVLTTYGLTEACSQVATQRPGTVNRGELGCGPPLPGTEVRIRDGAIEVRGPQLMSGYLPDDDSATATLRADGWLVTGDLGRLDGEGNLHVLGRRDDVIVTGGENVHPREVEEALEEHPSVAAVQVVGEPHDEWGMRVVARIVPAEADIDMEDLRRHCRERLARFKVPRRFEIVDRLSSSKKLI